VTERNGRAMDRRRFLTVSAAAAAGLGWLPLSRGVGSGRRRPAQLDDWIRAKMERDHIPGVGAAIVNGDGVIWEGAYGWADIGGARPMTLDTLQNVASISKTFTATAVMQLRDEGLLALDRDVNEYLPFPLRNPAQPGTAITIRQLMTHVSSLRDGTAYSRLYACADPKITLGVWLREYFTPGGLYHDAAENYAAWAPGERWEYCNVAFGVLGYLVELASGMPFPEYCRRQIFSRLDLTDTAWFLSDIDVSRHVVPYTWFDDGRARGPAWGGLELGVIRDQGVGDAALEAGEYRANCTYNHPNYPDGFLRTSVRQLARYVRAYLNEGRLADRRILARSTVAEMLSVQLMTDGRAQGLTWSAHLHGGTWAWGHGGSDPGVNNDIRMLPDRGVGAIVLTNTNGIHPTEFTDRLLDEALNL
jgi:CubicO group peptidase (beta-lactamase class C family)